MANTTTAISVGKRIREARRRAGLSQKRLAELIGTTRQAVIRWEKDRHLPNRQSREKIAAATGQEPDLFVDVHAQLYDTDEDAAMRARALELIAPFQRANGRRPARRVAGAGRGKKGRR